MLQFWLEVLGRAIIETLHTVGKEPRDIVFSITVITLGFVLLLVREGIRKGWRGMKSKIMKLVEEDMIIVLVLLLLIFVYHMFRQPYEAWESEKSRNDSKGKALVQRDSQLQSCSDISNNRLDKVNTLQSQITSQQTVINSQQGNLNSLHGTLANQQAAVTTCVGDLAKAVMPEP